MFSQPSTNLVNWPRISPEDSGELSVGKLGSRIGVSNLWFVFRRPCSTPARRHKPRIGSRPHGLNAATRARCP